MATNCNPFNHDQEKIETCDGALSYHNTSDDKISTTSQFIESEHYKSLDGAHVSFDKDSVGNVRLSLTVEWSKYDDLIGVKLPDFDPTKLKFPATHLYLTFEGGATSHIATFFVRDYPTNGGHHFVYDSDIIRSEILNQIINLNLTEISVTTEGYSMTSDEYNHRKNLSFALGCLTNSK